MIEGQQWGGHERQESWRAYVCRAASMFANLFCEHACHKQNSPNVSNTCQLLFDVTVNPHIPGIVVTETSSFSNRWEEYVTVFHLQSNLPDP